MLEKVDIIRVGFVLLVAVSALLGKSTFLVIITIGALFEIFLLLLTPSIFNNFFGRWFFHIWESFLLGSLLYLTDNKNTFFWYLWLFIPLPVINLKLLTAKEKVFFAVICDGVVAFLTRGGLFGYLVRFIGYFLAVWFLHAWSNNDTNDDIKAAKDKKKVLQPDNLLSVELEKAQAISRQSFQALELARDELSHKVRELHVLNETMTQISATLNLDNITQFIVTRSKEEIEAEASFLMLVQNGGKTLVIKKTEGLSEPTLKALSGEIDDIPLGVVIKERKFINYKYEPSENKAPAFIGVKEPIRTLLAVPLICSNLPQPLGVLGVVNALRGKEFTEKHTEFLATIAGQAAIAIANVYFCEELRHAHQGTIMRLSIAAEFRDNDTASHLRRMSTYSAIIASRLKLRPEQVELIQLASPMHDIGKIGIIDSILLKPDKLSPEELEEMKKHTIIGGAILNNAETELLKVSQQIALCHHERFDGSGYPKGLSGDKIPLAARIVAVADVFDALTSKRAYKPAYSVEDAIEYIKEQKGKHFDPQVADAFLSELPKIITVYNASFKQSSEFTYRGKLVHDVVDKEGWTSRY